MHAPLLLTLFAGDDAYEAKIADASFTKKGTGIVPVDVTWATAVQVTLPPGVPDAQGFMVRAVGADGEPVACSGGRSGIPVRIEPVKAKPAPPANPSLSVVATPSHHEPAAVCDHPYLDAKIVKAVEPEVSEAAMQAGAAGTVVSLVELREDGTPLSNQLLHPSGHDILDRSATRAALASTYAPQIFRCIPVAGAYTYVAGFYGQ